MSVHSSHHGSEDLHGFARYDNIAKGPSLTAFEQTIAQFNFCSNEEDWEVERVFSGESQHRRAASGGSTAGHDGHRECSDLNLE